MSCETFLLLTAVLYVHMYVHTCTYTEECSGEVLVVLCIV